MFRMGLLRARTWVWTLLVFSTLGAGIYFRTQIERHTQQITLQTAGSQPTRSGGTLMIAGGGELPDRVQRQFVELAGGKAAKLVVIPGVYVDDSFVKIYFDEWNNCGPASVHVLNASSPEEANDPAFAAPLEEATGVWLGGGQQTWLTSCYRGTRIEHKIRAVLERNGIVGGTSAGAAVMSEVMITGGRKKPSIGTGFGLLSGVIIDQHFIKRNRFSRLRQVVEANPKLVGIGIDESAALIVSLASRRVRVVGDSYIVVCLPEQIGKHYRVEVDFYNPGDEFQLSEPGKPELMLASSSIVEDWLDE
ncbi:MAG: cyanophycinase [Pirellulaceae bacterium]|nr:cyanophycinase [Pirellulaceae bacterium]